MEDLKQLSTVITQAYYLIDKINKDNRFEELVETNTKLLNKNIVLEKELDNLKNKYDNDMNIKIKELNEKSDELKNLTKVSFVQSLNKQVMDKNLIIQQLENQIIKLRANQANENKFCTPNLHSQHHQQYVPVVTEQPSPINITDKTNENDKTDENNKLDETIKSNNKKGVKKINTKQEEPYVEEIKETTTENETQEKSKKGGKKDKYIVEVTEQSNKEEVVIEEYNGETVIEESNEGVVIEENNGETVIEESNEGVVIEENNGETVIEEKPKKKKKEKQPKPFDPNDFEDVNGYELISYKKNYYLRDLETNELYNIIDNNPREIVGLLNSKGKVKFN
jgi:hypothetical protein